MRCSLLSSKGCQLMPTNPRCSGERCQYCDRFMSVLLLRSQHNYVRLVCGLRILVKRWGLNTYLFSQSISLQTEVATTIVKHETITILATLTATPWVSWHQLTALGAEQRATHNSVIIEVLQQTSLSTSDTILSPRWVEWWFRLRVCSDML